MREGSLCVREGGGWIRSEGEWIRRGKRERKRKENKRKEGKRREEKRRENKEKRKIKNMKGKFRHFTTSIQQVKLFRQTFSKTALAQSEKPLHRRSQSRSLF
jgi:hypothetical protein